MTDPADTRPYCKTMAKLVRLRVDPELTKAVVEQELFKDWYVHPPTHPPIHSSIHPPTHPSINNQHPPTLLLRCSSTYTHHVGTINWLDDGSMVYGAGDGSHFQVGQTHPPTHPPTQPKPL